MPAWFDLLRTPMAAPETQSLRRMRRIWQAKCLGLAGLVFWFAELRDMLGARTALSLAGALIVSTLCYTALYWLRKQQADQLFLMSDNEEAAR